MIEIKNVTKIYNINKKSSCKAIDNVSLVLPDSGMVFIIGKSGSGKSTLLNLIGGLDTPTEGIIISNKNEITSFKQSKLTNYRSSYIGFIFQDYHILDNFTVRQNIELANDINNIVDNERVDEILKVVELIEYQDRYPTELSGGQKQRVAVARALVKDSPVILCDEPTGNLDNKTSKQILDLLKKISQDKLVLIVSHNMADSNNYADRIIELYDGKIVRDRSRAVNYSNKFRIEDDTIFIPHFRDLTDEELKVINDEIKSNNNVKFHQIGNRFIESKINNTDDEQYNIQKSKVSRKTSKKLFRSFFKGKTIGMLLSVFIAALLISCFAVFQSFRQFDANSELSKTLVKNNVYNIPLQKGNESYDSYGMGSIKIVYPDEVDAFYESGFEGNIYKKYTNALPISKLSSSIETKKTFNALTALKDFYLKETLGVINCDMDFLLSLYGQDNNGQKEIIFLAKSADPKPYGIYITDYIADSIMLYRPTYAPDGYESMLGSYKYNNLQYGYINAIIKTNYKEKYSYLYESFNTILSNPNNTINTSELRKSNEYSAFIVEAMNFLGFGYSLEEHYIESLKTTDYRRFVKIGSSKLELDEEHIATYNMTFHECTTYKKELKHDEIILSKTIVTTLFPHIDVESYNPGDLTLTLNIYKDFGSEVKLYEKEFKIVSISGSTNLINLKENFDLVDYDVVPYGIYLDNYDNISEVMAVANSSGYIICVPDATKLSTINHVLNVFGKFFYFIETIFLVLCIVFILGIGVSSVKKNRYDIGVLKAIGTSNYDITRIYIKQSMLVCVFICIFTCIGIYIGTYTADAVLVAAFERLLKTTFYDLRLISFMPHVVVQDLIIVVGICIFSFIIPQLILFRIKPIDIIRAKE